MGELSPSYSSLLHDVLLWYNYELMQNFVSFVAVTAEEIKRFFEHTVVPQARNLADTFKTNPPIVTVSKLFVGFIDHCTY